MSDTLKNGILYRDDEVECMSQAFHGAWDILVESGSVYARPFKADKTRELLALKIIELVRIISDAELLQFEALAQLNFTPGPPLPLKDTTSRWSSQQDPSGPRH